MFPGGQDPFAHMFGMMNQMNSMMNSMMQDPLLGMPPPQMAPLQHQQYQQTAPSVEEVPHDVPADQGGRTAAGPIVEEPDDEGMHDDAGRGSNVQHAHDRMHYPSVTPQQQQQQQQQPPRAAPAPPPGPYGLQLSPFHADPFGGLLGGLMGSMLGSMGAGPGAFAGAAGGGGGQVYSYSSSTVISSGPNGTYHSSTTSRQAPGGVRETQKTIRDGRVGVDSMTLARGLGEKERVISRTRDATGQVVTEEHHQGLDPTSAQQFDQEWMQHAQQTMPSWMQQSPHGGSRQRLGSSGTRQQPQLALPPSAAAQGSGYGAGAGYGYGTDPSASASASAGLGGLGAAQQQQQQQPSYYPRQQQQFQYYQPPAAAGGYSHQQQQVQQRGGQFQGGRYPTTGEYQGVGQQQQQVDGGAGVYRRGASGGQGHGGGGWSGGYHV